MRIINAIMAVIGWTFTIFVLVAALGIGSVRMHFGPINFHVPVHSK